MRDLSDRFHQLISFMKPISLSASQCQVIIRVRDENDESLRVTRVSCLPGDYAQCPDRSGSHHICYNLLQYVTQRHAESRDTHYISFHFVCPQDYDNLPDLSNYLQICIHLPATIFSLLWLVSIPQLGVIFPPYCLYCERYDFNWTWGWVWFMRACPLFGLRITI